MMKYALIAVLMTCLSARSRAESIVFPEDAGLVDVVKMFGAKGDGKTDDTAAIQAAIAEGIKPGGNKRMYFRNGTYLLSEPVGLFDAKAHSEKRFMTVQGQSEAGTIFKLKDNCEGFQDPKKPGIVWSFYEGQSTGDAMHSYARNFTVDVGRGNPGAVGVRYMTNNAGTMAHVTIKSSDRQGAGAIGLDLRQSQNGPGLVQYVTVEGFDKGVATGNTFSMVLEHLTIKGQHEVGFDNPFGRMTLRDFKSDNSVTALRTGKDGEFTLLGAELKGGDRGNVAIVTEGRKVYLRDITQQGYGHILQTADGTKMPGDNLKEWHALKALALFDVPKIESLRLPIEQTPEVPWDTDLSKWITPDLSQGKDVTEPLQKVIDEGSERGATTLYFRMKKKYAISGPIRVHGSINRIIGMGELVDIADPAGVFKGENAPAVFTFEDLKSDTVVIEQFFLLGGWKCPSHVVLFENKTKATMVIESLGLRGQIKRAQPGGRWFIQDVSPGRQTTLQVGKGERLWARQYNPETYEADMIHVDGGQLWVLGLKTEGRTRHIVAENGSTVEVLGGVSYQSWGKQKLNPPMFTIIDSDASINYGLYNSGTSFRTVVEETRNGQTRALEAKDLDGYYLPLYRASGRR